jgi:hypothetical protein
MIRGKSAVTFTAGDLFGKDFGIQRLANSPALDTIDGRYPRHEKNNSHNYDCTGFAGD